MSPAASRMHLFACNPIARADRKSARLNSSHVEISYAVCLWKKTRNGLHHIPIFAFDAYCVLRLLHSFPTRRSSDLAFAAFACETEIERLFHVPVAPAVFQRIALEHFKE